MKNAASLRTGKKGLLSLTGALTLFIALALLFGTGCIPWVRWTTVSRGDGDQLFCAMTADGSRGTVIAWSDREEHLLAQRVGANGNALWNEAGVSVCTERIDRYNVSVVADGAGGAILSWVDRRSGDAIYARRVDANGNPLWQENGVVVCPDPDSPYFLDMIPDGAGGAIICWSEYLTGNSDIYAQRVSPNGDVLWGEDGVAVCTAGGHQNSPVMTGNGEDGAIVAWEDRRSGIDIYAQEISSDGSPAWAENGVAVCAAGGYQETPVTVSDQAGGAVIVWKDGRSVESGTDIYAQRLDGDGNSVWAADGVPVCAAGGDQSDPVAVDDGARGAIVAWEDYRPGSRDSDIYAQRLDSSGNRLWTDQGRAVCTAIYYQGAVFAVSDGRGGAILAWTDLRKGYREYGGYILWDADVFVQRMNSSGTRLWGADISNVSPNTEWSAGISPDGTGGAVVAWEIDTDVHHMYTNIDVAATRVTDWSLWTNRNPGLKDLLR